MNIRKKIIGSLVIMILSVSCILLLSMVLSVYEIRRSGDVLITDLRSKIEENVREELSGWANTIGDFILAIESEIENNMRNAANVLYEVDRLSGGRLTLEDLERVRLRTGMSDLYVGGIDGVFTLSTEPEGIGLSLFDIWDDYRRIVTGETDFIASDLRLKVETGEVFKFAIIPRANDMGVIEVALEASAVEDHLQSFIYANLGIRSMNLFDSNLLTLTSNHARGIQPIHTKGTFVSPGTTKIDAFFNGYDEVKLIFDNEHAQIYLPIFDGNRTRYVLFIDLDTSGYFLMEQQIDETMTDQVQQSSFLHMISMAAVLVVLLIFTLVISLMINKILGTAEEQNKTIMDSINYASNIQRNLLPPEVVMENVFSDSSVIWKPRDIVGGDIYWIKQFDKGSVLCVCDCTGHGTPGALLTMLVISTLESIIWPHNCDDTAGIIWLLDRKLSAVMHSKPGGDIRRGIMDIKDGCDIAVVFISKEGSVRFSAGKIPIFICDGTTVIQHKGQKIFVGEGKINSKDEVNVYDIPANTNNKFYIASDGLFEQRGDAGRQFGYNTFKRIIIENHDEKQSVVTDMVWEAFEEYRGKQAQRDDFELIAFKP